MNVPIKCDGEMTSFTIRTSEEIREDIGENASSFSPDLSGPLFFVLPTAGITPHQSEQLMAILSAQELEKAARFRFMKDRLSYIATHASLRTILGRYLRIDPKELEFMANSCGKPALTAASGLIRFNISHRAGYSVLAFSPECEVGIDIEYVDPDFDYRPIAETWFSPKEKQWLPSDPAVSRDRFFTLWTRKEAFLKAVGCGLGNNLAVEICSPENRVEMDIPAGFPVYPEYGLQSFGFSKHYIITAAASVDSSNWKGYLLPSPFISY